MRRTSQSLLFGQEVEFARVKWIKETLLNHLTTSHLEEHIQWYEQIATHGSVQDNCD